MNETEIRERMPEGEALEEAMRQAYRLYQDNIRATAEDVFRLTRGARDGVPESELLEIAVRALDKCRYPEA